MTLPEKHIRTIEEYTLRISRQLQVCGVMNIQYAICLDKVYVLEANPNPDLNVGGIDINDDGAVDLDLAALGANPFHKDLFVEPEQVKLSVILLKVDPSSTQAVWNDQRDTEPSRSES